MTRQEIQNTLERLATLDHHRAQRTGIPEAVFSEGKTPEQVCFILQELARKAGIALATRVSVETASLVQKQLNGHMSIEHNALGRTVVARRQDYELQSTGGVVAVLCAGTADAPVAEEARVTAEVMGCEVVSFYDVGVAGIHRLVHPLETILRKDVSAIVVVAGMEGALPSVVRGLVPVPVIGVPTSVGYGYGGKGKAALMSMLQSCAPGMTVVNIDNGFGAGATAALYANMVVRARLKAKEPESSSIEQSRTHL